MKSSHNAKINYILSQAFQGFVDLLCKCQVMQHLFVLFHSHLEKKKQDGFFFFYKIHTTFTFMRSHLCCQFIHHQVLPSDPYSVPHPGSASSCSLPVSAVGTQDTSHNPGASTCPLVLHFLFTLPRHYPTFFFSKLRTLCLRQIRPSSM